MQEAIKHLKKADKRLSKVIDKIGELDSSTYNDCDDSFFFLVKEIVGQMIPSGVKKVVFGRLMNLCNGRKHIGRPIFISNGF